MNLNINTGEIRLTINEDPKRVVKFNPRDLRFAEAFYKLLHEFNEKEVEYQCRAKEIDARADGGVEEGIALLREICEWMRKGIDSVFGKGTSNTVFGDAMSLEVIFQFLDGVTPFIQEARQTQLERYMKHGGETPAGAVMQ